MDELEVDSDGRYVRGDVPLGYTLWDDRLIEVPAELDAAVTAIRLVKQGKQFEAIAASVSEIHGVQLTQQKFDALIHSVFRRYGPI